MNLKDCSAEALFTELARRFRQLERDARQLGSVGLARELVPIAFEAGSAAARADLLLQLEQRISQLLDEVTARAPEPPPEGADPQARVEHARGERRALWLALENMRQQFRAEAALEQGVAVKRRSWLEIRSAEILVPAVPLRQRLGQWLLAQSARMAQRGAA